MAQALGLVHACTEWLSRRFHPTENKPSSMASGCSLSVLDDVIRFTRAAWLRFVPLGIAKPERDAWLTDQEFRLRPEADFFRVKSTLNVVLRRFGRVGRQEQPSVFV